MLPSNTGTDSGVTVKGAKVTRSADSLELLLPGADLRRGNVVIFGDLLNRLLVLHHLSGEAGFEFGTQAPPFSFAHLVLFRVGRPQKPTQFINKSLAPFRGATSKKPPA
jgi:hypothetical protein